jgi:DNA processing protein
MITAIEQFQARSLSRLPYEPPTEVRRLVLVDRAGAHVPNLYAAGDVSLLERATVAVIGSRKASPHALATAAAVSRELVAVGVVVVSGLAAGVDVAAHRAAMEAGGRTIAVIGTPLERAYPVEHAVLQEEIWREHLLVSPFAAGARVGKGNFPARNRVMARLSDATVLVAAEETSGTVHAVREALALKRRVLVNERLFRRQISWLRSIAMHPQVFVWRGARELAGQVGASEGRAT